MHELFTKVLSKRDLSRAGDLFSVSDSEIVEYLTEVVSISYSCRLIIFKSIFARSVTQRYIYQQAKKSSRRYRYFHV